MLIKHRFLQLLIKLFFAIIILECFYLYSLPCILESIAKHNSLTKSIENSTNIQLQYKNPKFKTHLKPDITVQLQNILVQDKQNQDTLLKAENVTLKISLFPLILKKINLKYLFADNLEINIKKDENGVFNFENLLHSQDKKSSNFSFKNTELNINSYKINTQDKQLDSELVLNGKPLIFKNDKKNNKIHIKTKGSVNTVNNISEFDINILSGYPFDYKKFDDNTLDGSCLIYNLDLHPLLPYLQKYVDKNISKFDGFIEYLQLSTVNPKNNQKEITLNSKFNNVVFDKSNWKNYIIMNGENKLDTNFDFASNIININSFNYKADNVNIKALGTITLNNPVELDINAEVKESKAENIAAILPPTLVPQYMTIEKIKTYGIYGDLEGKANIKGKIPQPDVTGYVKAKNVHILDKTMHKSHVGTVNLNFDKRILNMDILVNFIDNQKAFVNGYVYMYRDGLNNVSVKTTDNIDFPLAQKIILPLSKVFNFQLGPIPDMNITSGKGIIDVNIKGSTEVIYINGFSNFYNAYLTYNGLFGEIKDGKGKLDFKDDVISFKSEKAFVKNNPLKVEGKVRINKDLDFNISSDSVKADDLLEIINKSSLLKDVKEGVAIITDASGLARIFVNIKAKIVPLAYGQAPLPPEEAFEDMKVNGALYLLGNSCFIEGFKTPFEKLKGIVDFTETIVNLRDLQAVSGSSPIAINGQIINDLETKIPDVDIIVTSKSVNLKDTIRFLTQSYLYPDNYPDLSNLYKIASKHDLYFKYKAKAIDFITDKAYAVMNFVNDDTDNPIKANSGRIILDKSTVKVENVNAALFDSNFNVFGEVKNVDTINPVYNLKLQADKFNLANLNNADKITILPDKIKDVFNQFYNYKGLSDVRLELNKNILKGDIKLYKPQCIHLKTKSPINFDDFTVYVNDNKININNVTASIGDIPFYGDIRISDVYSNPNINGYFTSKLTNDFIKNYMPGSISEKLAITGDVNLSVKFSGTQNNMNISPKLTFNPEADVFYNGINLGEINDKREFNSDININGKKITLDKFEYIKYIASQNNKTYPVVFLTTNGIFNINADNIIETKELNVKTNKNLSAKFLNLLFKTPISNQGTFSCDLKYFYDVLKKTAKIKGKIDCSNLDIPLFDMVIKNIKLNAEEDDISINMFGFISDARINVKSIFKNNLLEKPKILSIKILAEQIDNDKLLKNIAQTRKAVNSNNFNQNIDFSDLYIENGYINIKTMTVKALTANNLTSNFSIDKNGIFHANDISLELGQGNMQGKISYNLNNTEMEGDFELNNVDSNYVAETLFDGKNQIFGNGNGKVFIKTKGTTNEEIIKNLSGFVYFDMSDGKLPKLGSLEYLLRASNILKSGLTGLTLNSILELLNLVKTGYFTNINGSCVIENGIAKNIEIYSKSENLSLYIHGTYDISKTHADLEILGKLSKRISTIFGAVGNTSLNTFFKLIPGISLMEFSRKNLVKDVEKIPPFTNGDYDSRTFQAIIDGNINESGYVQSFKWVQ